MMISSSRAVYTAQCRADSVAGRRRLSFGFVEQPRKRASRCRGASKTVCSAGRDEQDLDQLLQEDLKRLQNMEQGSMRDQSPLPSDAPSSSLKELVDKALIADFFFILFALGWLGAGVGLKSATGVTGLLDAWLALWQWVFQPAIGVLMLGALVSGGIGWLREKSEESS